MYPVHLSGLSPKWRSALQPPSRLSSACGPHLKNGEAETTGSDSPGVSQTFRRTWSAHEAGRTTWIAVQLGRQQLGETMEQIEGEGLTSRCPC